MKKAYNVYKIFEKTSTTLAFRRFTLLFAMAVCFLGFQTQGVAQQVVSLSNPPTGLISPIGGFSPEDAPFLREFTFTKSTDEAVNILRDQKRFVMDGGEPDSGIAELDYAIRFQFLDGAVKSLLSGSDVTTALGENFVKVDRTFASGQNQVDIQGIVESYARLLE